ncbi:response regulator transcription factor [Tenacibaculum sp. 190524A02b]|uniref:DNA-binding response regulator, LytR/AlgR family n=1 Tax=Tenacibaculum vairaonense TaxID=3137860 RepID=A0ABP1FGZ2_9FLAO
MQKIKILILEDDLEQSELLKQLLVKNYTVIGSASNYMEAVALYHMHAPDLAILDIFIEDKREGIRFAEYINKNTPIPILFLTNAKDNISFSEAKNTKPYNYLLKPVDPFGIKFTIELAIEKFANQVGQLSTKEKASLKINDELFIKKKDSLFKISKNDMFYIEADDKYCHIHTENTQFMVQKTLKSFTEEFKNIFIKTHRKYLVNKSKIARIDTVDYNIILKNNISIPLSQRHKKEVIKALPIFK